MWIRKCVPTKAKQNKLSNKQEEEKKGFCKQHDCQTLQFFLLKCMDWFDVNRACSPLCVTVCIPGSGLPEPRPVQSDHGGLEPQCHSAAAPQHPQHPQVDRWWWRSNSHWSGPLPQKWVYFVPVFLFVCVCGVGVGVVRGDGEEGGSSYSCFSWRKHIASEAMLMISPIMEYCSGGVKIFMWSLCSEFRSVGKRGGGEEVGEGTVPAAFPGASALRLRQLRWHQVFLL